MRWRTTRKVIAAGIVVIAAVSVWVGCGGGVRATGGIQLFLADDPLDAKAVNVTISKVAVSKDGVGWVTIRDFSSSPVTINLLDYRYDGNTLTPDTYLLADAPLEAGHYEQIRLILTSIEIVDNSGTSHACEMNSQDRTGLKLVGEFDVAAGAKSAVLIDFNAAKSIVAMGNGRYRLQPTVKVVPMQITGLVHGIVQFKDAGGSDTAVPVGATISAYQDTTLAASALIGADGSFGMQGLVEGSYTLKIETPGFSAPDTVVQVTAGGETDAGTITASAQ